MKTILDKIRAYLKKVPSHAISVPATASHMAFFAEWQDWSFVGEPTERLFLGYYETIDGEMANDPLLIFDWRNGELIDVQISQFVIPGLRPCDPCFARDFLETVHERHFQGGAE